MKPPTRWRPEMPISAMANLASMDEGAAGRAPGRGFCSGIPAPILGHVNGIPLAYLRFPPQARKRKVPWYRAQHAEPAIPPAFTGRGPLAFHHEGEGLRPFRQKDGLCLCLVRHHTLVLILRLTMFNSARGGR